MESAAMAHMRGRRMILADLGKSERELQTERVALGRSEEGETRAAQVCYWPLSPRTSFFALRDSRAL